MTALSMPSVVRGAFSDIGSSIARPIQWLYRQINPVAAGQPRIGGAHNSMAVPSYYAALDHQTINDELPPAYDAEFSAQRVTVGLAQESHAAKEDVLFYLRELDAQIIDFDVEKTRFIQLQGNATEKYLQEKTALLEGLNQNLTLNNNRIRTLLMRSGVSASCLDQLVIIKPDSICDQNIQFITQKEAQIKSLRDTCNSSIRLMLTSPELKKIKSFIQLVKDNRKLIAKNRTYQWKLAQVEAEKKLTLFFCRD